MIVNRHEEDSDGVVTFHDIVPDNALIECTYPVSECQVIDGKGRSLVAISDMYIGSHPLNPQNEDISALGWCEPLIAPVLMKGERTTRCSFCFRQLKYGSPHTRQLHYHCSKQCQKKDKNYAAEEKALRMIRMMQPNIECPPPTVLLVSRILRHSFDSPSIREKFNELCFNITDLSQKEKKEYMQVMNSSHAFLRFIENGSSQEAFRMANDPPEAYAFLSRIMMNGFTVSTTEQMGIGIGIYPGASMINHSCRPNAVQSFHFFPPGERTSNIPMLQITTCREVKAGEEITISYCDGTSPRHMRRKELWEGYKFDCDCFWCKKIYCNTQVLGLKCPDSSCRGRIVCVNSECSSSSSMNAQDPKYKCDSCGFERHVAILAELTQNVRNIEKTMKNEAYGEDIGFVEETGFHLNKTFDFMKQICSTQTSWYVAWCADAIIHWAINALQFYDSERMQEHTCIKALLVLNESIPALRACFNYPGSLKWRLIQVADAKLRLFVNPTDMDAYGLLWDAKRYLALFVPVHDELLASLDQSILDYTYVNDVEYADPMESESGHSQEEVRVLWIINRCQDYSTDPDKDNFFCRYLEEQRGVMTKK
jgi:SET and MYND domain-containing protein